MKPTSQNYSAEKLQSVMPATTMDDVRFLQAADTTRQRQIAEQGTLFFKVAALLYRHDPEGVSVTDSEHEYEGEAGTIIERLPACRSSQDCFRVVTEEFSRWFDGRISPGETYAKISAEIWELWQTQKP